MTARPERTPPSRRAVRIANAFAVFVLVVPIASSVLVAVVEGTWAGFFIAIGAWMALAVVVLLIGLVFGGAEGVRYAFAHRRR